MRIGSKQSALLKCSITAKEQGKVELETQLRREARVEHFVTACLSLGSSQNRGWGVGSLLVRESQGAAKGRGW